MCSIIGGTFTAKFKSNVSKYLDILSHRGVNEGCGYIHIKSTGDIKVYKTLNLKTLKVQIQNTQVGGTIIIHQRKSSVGKVSIENTHPVKSGKGTQVHLVHNGTNKIYHGLLESTSDSHGMAILLGMVPIERHKEALRNLGVVFYTFNGQVYFYRDGIRPLVVNSKKTIFSSEPLYNGEWTCVDTSDPIPFDNVACLPLTKDTGTVEFTTPHKAKYCSGCKKIHLGTTDSVCGICSIKGIAPTVTNPHTWHDKVYPEYYLPRRVAAKKAPKFYLKKGGCIRLR